MILIATTHSKTYNGLLARGSMAKLRNYITAREADGRSITPIRLCIPRRERVEERFPEMAGREPVPDPENNETGGLASRSGPQSVSKALFTKWGGRNLKNMTPWKSKP